MKRTSGRSKMPVLRGYLYGESEDEKDRNAGRIAEFIVEKAISGHFAYFTLVHDVVDGKLRRSAEDERTFAPGCVLVGAEDERKPDVFKAA
jgi:hypothetical protein